MLNNTIIPDMIKGERFYCPICDNTFRQSDYLVTVINDDKALWLANMITHYRHNHINWWNNRWGRGGYGHSMPYTTDYDNEKEKVNEQAKRQIIRKTNGYLIQNGIVPDHFNMLENNDEKTIVLAKKKLQAHTIIKNELKKTKTSIL